MTTADKRKAMVDEALSLSVEMLDDYNAKADNPASRRLAIAVALEALEQVGLVKFDLLSGVTFSVIINSVIETNEQLIAARKLR